MLISLLYLNQLENQFFTFVQAPVTTLEAPVPAENLALLLAVDVKILLFLQAFVVAILFAAYEVQIILFFTYALELQCIYFF